ncbi:MAG: sugar-transfer associated ATP-grasp domain-containing protein [Acidobacteriota bacterium]
MATSLSKIAAVASRCRAAADHYGASFPAVFRRVTQLRLVERYRPKETFLWGLADPNLPDAQARRYLSRAQVHALQLQQNPMSLSYLTEDKAVFYAYCRGNGIRIPELYGVFHRAGGWSTEGPVLHGRGPWRELFEQELPPRFVVKPSKGVYARGLRVLERKAGTFEDPTGETLTAEELHDALAADPDFGTFVIQERLDNDPSIERLSGRRALQTVRAVTLVDDERREPQLLFACLKVIVGAGDSDNFDYGRSGNLLADIDLDSGRLRQVRGGHGSGFGLVTHEVHPETGAKFADFVVPHWPRLRRLALEAAIKFLPLRTIGWDIAVTPSGPSIVEGNVWWDPLHNAHQHLPRYVDASA